MSGTGATGAADCRGQCIYSSDEEEQCVIQAVLLRLCSEHDSVSAAGKALVVLLLLTLLLTLLYLFICLLTRFFEWKFQNSSSSQHDVY